jgi:predicted transcriptional regulator
MLPLPTGAELEILAVLWRLGPSTVREVYEALGKESVYTTTLKQMQVMAEKGLLTRSQRYRSHVYEAVAPMEDTQQQLAGDLLRRAFAGSAANLVLGALKAQPASEQDMAEIRRVLKEFAKRERSR